MQENGKSSCSQLLPEEKHKYYSYSIQVQYLNPVNLATWEEDIRKNEVQCQLGQSS
jgi:hypothetical protein